VCGLLVKNGEWLHVVVVGATLCKLLVIVARRAYWIKAQRDAEVDVDGEYPFPVGELLRVKEWVNSVWLGLRSAASAIGLPATRK
jgi:hypothetical protein